VDIFFPGGKLNEKVGNPCQTFNSFYFPPAAAANAASEVDEGFMVSLLPRPSCDIVNV